VLTGEDDPLVTAEGAEEIARVCGGRHQQLPGVGHSLSAEAPELLTRLITQFLQTA
jgi:pimeloyl-ACP methyl ester carboxylesterase